MKRIIFLLILLALLLPAHSVVADSEEVTLPYFASKTFIRNVLGEEFEVGKILCTFKADGTVEATGLEGVEVGETMIIGAVDNTVRVYQEWTPGGRIVTQKLKDMEVIWDFTYSNKIKITYKGDYTGRIEIPVKDKKKTQPNLTANTDNYQVSVGDNTDGKAITYDWSDAKEVIQYKDDKVYFDVDGAFEIDPSIVVPSGYIQWDTNRNLVYAVGRYWVFYLNLDYPSPPGESAVCYKSSLDGENWTLEDVALYDAGVGNDINNCFDVAFDGTYIHLSTEVYHGFATDETIHYRRGEPKISGTITWSAAMQTVADDAGIDWHANGIGVDSGGYPFIVCTDSNDDVQVTKSSTNDGTWVTAGGFPVVLDTTLLTFMGKATLLPLTANKMYCLWDESDTFGQYTGCLWNGAAWGALENIGVAQSGGLSYTHSAVAYGDIVELIYMRDLGATDTIASVTRSAVGVWSAPTNLDDETGFSRGMVTLLNDSGDLDVYHVPHNGDIEVIRRLDGVWQDSVLVLEDIDELRSVHRYFTNYEAIDGHIGFNWRDDDETLWFTSMDWRVPICQTQPAIYVSKHSARLLGYISDDGDDTCEVRFAWDDDGAGEPYAHTTAWVDGYNTGDYPYVNIDGLDADVQHFYRVEVRNDVGTCEGNEEDFTTTAAVAVPTEFKAISSSTTVELTWVKGAGSTNTLVKYRIGSFPADPSQGEQVYFDMWDSVTHTGLTPGTTYFYSAWGESESEFSLTAATIEITTLAEGEEAAGVDAPATFSTWFQAPDHTRMSVFPLYGFGNSIADTVGMPYGTMWMLFAVIMILAVGTTAWGLSRNSMALGIVILLGVVVASWVGLLPLALVFILGIIGVGILMAGRFV